MKQVLCQLCAYENSDCKGNKEAEKTHCDYYKKPAVFNANEAAERIADLEAKIKALLQTIEEICRDVRETYGGEDMCGLCEYDGAYLGVSGDWMNECPGFETDECFKLSERFKAKYIGKEEDHE